MLKYLSFLIPALNIHELIFKKVHSLFDTQKKEAKINI
jgi:hypothetical protein